jgi:hypothetical protein
VAARLERHPRIARTEARGRAGAQGVVQGTLRAGTDEEDAAQQALDLFAGRDDVTSGGPAVAGLQIGETVSEDLARPSFSRSRSCSCCR